MSMKTIRMSNGRPVNLLRKWEQDLPAVDLD